MAPCKFLQVVQDVEAEAGGDPGGTVFCEYTDCQLGLLGVGEDCEPCKQTPECGPCWQMKEQFTSVEEWEAWAHQQR